MSEALQIGWTTCDNQDVAERLAFDLIERRLAACVQIESVQSVYRFDGEVQNESELRLAIKFPSEKGPAIEAYLTANHPYDTPEWIVLPCVHASPRYLSWAQSETS